MALSCEHRDTELHRYGAGCARASFAANPQLFVRDRLFTFIAPDVRGAHECGMKGWGRENEASARDTDHNVGAGEREYATASECTREMQC